MEGATNNSDRNWLVLRKTLLTPARDHFPRLKRAEEENLNKEVISLKGKGEGEGERELVKENKSGRRIVFQPPLQ